MKLSSKLLGSIIRIILGVVFAIIGYQLGGRYFAESYLSIPKDLLRTIFAFICGAGAIFILPLAVAWIVSSVTRWVMHVVQTTLAKAMSDFWTQRTRGRFGKKSEDKKEDTSDDSQSEGQEDLSNAVLLDTSGIIDGRIVDVVNAGFLGELFIVPQFVLEELQKIADSDDKIKRERGRRGLELLEELKGIKGVKLEISEFSVRTKDVDAALVKLATKHDCKIATVDYNLNKVASLSGVKILNINELANALKTVVLPGEKLSLKIIQPGKEENQGVGYLADGTMIVVENGADKMGQEVKVEVSRILQTVAGRMVFAQIPPKPKL